MEPGGIIVGNGGGDIYTGGNTTVSSVYATKYDSRRAHLRGHRVMAAVSVQTKAANVTQVNAQRIRVRTRLKLRPGQIVAVDIQNGIADFQYGEQGRMIGIVESYSSRTQTADVIIGEAVVFKKYLMLEADPSIPRALVVIDPRKHQLKVTLSPRPTDIAIPIARPVALDNHYYRVVLGVTGSGGGSGIGKI